MTINELFRQSQAGEKSAEEELFAFLAERFRLFLRHKIADARDAEDVMQEALAVVASKYRSLPSDCAIVGWAHGVLNFEVLRYYRTKGLRKVRNLQLPDEETVFNGWECEPDLVDAIIHCLVRLHKVNPKYARILNLHYQGYTPEEVCSRLGVSINHYYVLLSRARSQLRQCLSKEYPES